MGHIGVNRFEEGEKSLTIPNQVIEEWIDDTLRQDEEEKVQDKKDGNSDQLPASMQAGKGRPTVRYHLDYTSLLKSGIQPELAQRL